MWLDHATFDHDQKKQPFNERLVEMIRGKRENVFAIMYDNPDQIPTSSICVQYNYKQKPKTSYGIAFHNTRTKKWFVVEPAMTIEMRLLVQGFYSDNMLPFLVEQLYASELQTITAYSGNFAEFFFSLVGHYPKNTLHERIWTMNYPKLLDMARRMLAYRLISGFNESQYVFPKGRPDDSEAFFLTAIREVEEETRIKVLFENPEASIRQLSRHGSFPRMVSSPPIHYHAELEPVKQTYWEHCRISIPGCPLEEAYICKEYVSHAHADISGKLYKTTLWICVFDGVETLHGDITMNDGSETRLGRWVSEEELRLRFRVQDLYAKCEGTLNKYFPYLTL